MNWISVDDKLPLEGQKVLLFRPKAFEKPFRDPIMKIATYAGENIFIGSHFQHVVTHWMPLPQPPVEKEEG